MKYRHLYVFLSLLLMGCKSNPWASKKAKTHLFSYIEHQFESPIMGERRTIKVFLPEGYDPEKKYPVIYALDGDWMFEITATFAKYLINFQDEYNIPPALVVGIFHSDRTKETRPNYGMHKNIPWDQWLPGTQQFKNHLFSELVPRMDALYATSGYNVLIGHSDTASTGLLFYLEKDNPFDGIIALSPDLLEDQIELLTQKVAQSNDHPRFFVGSGSKDGLTRIETGERLDAFFMEQDQSGMGQHLLVEAGHNDLVVKTLLSGIESMFFDYLDFSDFNEKVVQQKTPFVTYFAQKKDEIKKTYGIEMTVSEDSYYLMEEAIIDAGTEHLLDAFYAYMDENVRPFPGGIEDYSLRAQSYEAIGAYEKSLRFWALQIENGYRDNVFYYRRPARLLLDKLHRPEKAFQLYEKACDQYPEGMLFFQYQMAKIAKEHGVCIEKGKQALYYCQDHFEENSWFTKADLTDLAQPNKSI